MNKPALIFADSKGKIYTHPYLKMLVSSLDQPKFAQEEDLIKLPQGTKLFFLANQAPVGFNPYNGNIEVYNQFKGKRVFAVGAFLIPGYVRLSLPATVRYNHARLPLWAYAGVGFYAGNFYVAASKIDRRIRQSPKFYDYNKLEKSVKEIIKESPKNRLYKHLANCALQYHCLAAKNFFLTRWEAPLPTARVCNARCLGCLSYKDSDCNGAHERITFSPTKEEMVELLTRHLSLAKEAIVSFGQGCEGEPLSEADNIALAIEEVRSRLSRGTIHMNTNASYPKKIEILCKAGMDSFRISLNSTRAEVYNCYFRPVNYSFWEVIRSIEIAKKYKKFVSVNLFVFPGVTDSQEEEEALIKFIKNTRIDMILWRNLNIDPYYYLENIPKQKSPTIGVRGLIKTINRLFPKLKMGYFNLPKEQFTQFENLVE